MTWRVFASLCADLGKIDRARNVAPRDRYFVLFERVSDVRTSCEIRGGMKMKMLRSCVLGGIVAASLCGPMMLHAQALDSLGRPRPLPQPASAVAKPNASIRIWCGNSRHRGTDATYRIIGADGQLLYMSSPDTATARSRDTTALGSLGSLDLSQIASIEVQKGAAVEQAYGKAYASGLIVIVLDAKGTEAWLRAESARGAKPEAAAPTP
jgi:hypothetical protein